ncbi:MAG: cupin [Pseudomonas sp.]|jgi:uncharacterized protein YjlB|uniref:Twin-arginine translocation pathway signal and cupin region containing protein n=1 Tax=Pseudomonas sp. CFII64 TaxID=911242 RepID=UPI000357CEBD|nr:Twin-arginine translocation pathway signal and cupin region containing protein [Pseudomonas sp. CFII64]
MEDAGPIDVLFNNAGALGISSGCLIWGAAVASLSTSREFNRNRTKASTRRQFSISTLPSLPGTGALTMKQTPAVQTLMLNANSGIPNNPKLPVLIYPAALDVSGSDPAELVERSFTANGWPPQWRYGVFSYHHYHTRGHEVLGVYAGDARLMLGGPEGHVVEVKAGDVLLLPAGTGHCNLGSSNDFMVVGAYPPAQDGDINRDPATPAQIEQIAQLWFPQTDPVLGDKGGVVEHWRG